MCVCSDVPALAQARKPGQARPKIAKPSRAKTLFEVPLSAYICINYLNYLSNIV